MTSEKRRRLLAYLKQRWNGACAIAKERGEYAPVTELHHRCHNTKRNRKKYPLFIDSLMNVVAVNHNWHMRFPSALKIREDQAARAEAHLRAHPEKARAMNLGICDLWRENAEE